MTSARDVMLNLGPRTLAQVAHDVRSPTSAILAFLDFAAGEEELDDGAFEDLLPLAQRGISRLLLLADLLTILSDVLESPRSVAPVPTDAEGLIEAAIRAASHVSMHTLVDVRVDDDVPFFEADPGMTVPCIAALIGHTWRRAGVTVAVRVVRCDGGVEVRVEPETEDDSDDTWSVVSVDDESKLGERVTALVLQAHGSALQRRRANGRASAYRMIFEPSSDLSSPQKGG